MPIQSRYPLRGRRAGVKMGRAARRRRCILVVGGRDSVWRRSPTAGSRTVALSTPIRVPVPHRAPGQPEPTPTMVGGRLVAQDGDIAEVEAAEEILAQVAAIDVAKASGMVCTRVPHPAKPGQRAT